MAGNLRFYSNLRVGKPRVVFFIMAILLACAVYACMDAFSSSKVSFNADVRPIINSKCIACHGGVKKSGNFSLLFREEALGKTKSGKPAIVPGDPDNSELMRRITSHDEDIRMPLEKNPLTKEEIGIFKKWIAQGAKWEEHWSFIPPKAAEVPDVEDDDFVKNDIDHFILQKLGEQKLEHAAPADKPTLIRRVSLDLTGLPPTEKEVQDFVNDRSANAYEKVVDRLLASPGYGERWAAMWLDLARYSDTKGYEKDQHRNIWRYRDYVIRSFNEDKPYDKFTIEQLAGDLLPDPTEDQIIATAFHRNTMNNDEGGTDNEEFRVAELIDRVNTTFDVWQGITIGCVQCHTHPYDPIRHNEYYNFMAFLNNTRDNDLPEEAPTYVSAKDYDLKKAESIINQLKRLTGDKTATPASFKDKRRKYLLPVLYAKDFDQLANTDFNHPTVRFLGPGSYVAYKNVNLSGIAKIGCKYTSDKGGVLEVHLGKPSGPLLGAMNFANAFGEYYQASFDLQKPLNGLHDLYFVFKLNDKGVADGRIWEFYAWPPEKKEQTAAGKQTDSLKIELAKAINPPGTPVFEELTDTNRRQTYVFERGNWLNKGAKANGAVPRILNPLPKGAPNNRLGMAMWLASANNPLTARVAVNRFWEQLFGYGIVETLEDFGSQGIKPTHPELLDWMAVKFMKDYRWSMKKILKLMVLSGTYRQSSVATPEQLKQDERNLYLARGPRVRLTAEQIRDQALAVSGLLSKKMYGQSVMPYQPDGVWQTVYSGMEWRLSEGEDKYRRALYTYMRRTSPYPNMLTFDAPSREFCMTRRIRTNTPLQALATLNDTVYTQVSVALAKRMIAEGGPDLSSQIKRGYQIALAHNPDTATLNKLSAFYRKTSLYYSKNKQKAKLMAGGAENAGQVAPLSLVASAIINQDEFVTKE